MTDAPLLHDVDDDPEAAAARRVQALKTLAEIGMDMSRALRDQICAGGLDDAALCDLSLAFTDVAEAVRLTIGLRARLEAERRARSEVRGARGQRGGVGARRGAGDPLRGPPHRRLN